MGLTQVITIQLKISKNNVYREGVCSPGHFLKGAESNFLENQINWYYA